MIVSQDQSELAAFEAERSIVAALFSEHGAEAFDRIAIDLEDTDFFFSEHRVVFSAFRALIDSGSVPDAPTLASHIRATAEYSHKVRDAIAEASAAPFSLDNIEAYANAVSERAKARKIRERLSNLGGKTSLIGGDLSSNQLLAEIDSVSQEFDKERGVQGLLLSTQDHLKSFVEKMEVANDAAEEGVRVGITLCIDELDEQIGGVVAGDLVVLAARPSMGKSALALQIGLANAQPRENGKDEGLVAVFSLEMETDKLMGRTLANLGAIELERIKKQRLDDNDWARLTVAFQKFDQCQIRFDTDSELTPATLRSKLRMLTRRTGKHVKLIVIDYLQLMDADPNSRGPQSNRQTEIAYISRNLKKIAKDFGAVVIALSQLNRSVEQRPNKRPLMSDLRESGAIEQDADVIAMIYRDEVYNPDSDAKGIAEIIVNKARDGHIGTVATVFEGQYQRFRSLHANQYSYDSKYGGTK